MPDRRSCSHSEPTRDTLSPAPEELAGALTLPEAYPHRPHCVAFRQTQMSLLFFAGEFVYKIKKPVDLGYLDYTSLDRRHFFCEREVELNRRLCPNVYLGVVPVTRRNGRLCVEGEGDAVEYAVKMRRLPQEHMLDRLLDSGEANTAMMQSIASRVAAFHARAATSAEISKFGSIATIRFNTEENFEQTLQHIGRTITLANHNLLREYTNGYLERQSALLDRRVQECRIRDCHGDLHAAHMCMTEAVCIYDCIEFNDRFRYGDIASEVAFLAMDLDRYRRRNLSQSFVNAYIAASGDAEVLVLMPFYKCYRAVVRGKVEGFKLGDSLIPAEERRTALWLARAYYQLARSYATGQGLLIIMSGLTGSGKSMVAEALGSLLAGTVISSDVIRKQLAGLAPDERRYEPFGQGIYAADWTRRTYEEMLRLAQQELAGAGCAILDASFLRARERTRAQEVASRTGARALMVECIAPADVLLQRLAERQAQGSVSDGRPEILEGQIAVREAVAEFAEGDHLRIDTTLDSEAILEEIWQRL